MVEINISPLYISDSDLVINFLFEKYDDFGRSLDFWQKRTQLWWQKNPCYNESLPIGWGLWAGGEIVGYLGCIFTALQFNGKQYTSLNLTCWHVEPSFRNYSLDLFLKANAFMPEAIYFNTSPTSQVEKILKASKYEKYIFGKNDLKTKIVPLNLHHITGGRKLNLFIKICNPLLKIVNEVVLVYLRLMWNNKKICLTDIDSISIDEHKQFLKKSFSDVLTIDRSINFYKWLTSGEGNRYYVFVVKDSSTPKIHAIGLFHTYVHKNNEILELIDFCSLKNKVYTDKIIFRKMITHVFSQRNIFSRYVAISVTNYSGINLESCDGKLITRTRNNKYYKTSNSYLKLLIDTNQFIFTAQGDMCF